MSFKLERADTGSRKRRSDEYNERIGGGMRAKTGCQSHHAWEVGWTGEQCDPSPLGARCCHDQTDTGLGEETKLNSKSKRSWSEHWRRCSV